jgi:hypothetical protein
MQLERAIEGAFHLLTRWFLAELCIWKRPFPTKRQLTFHGLHGVIPQNIDLFWEKKMGCVGLAPLTDSNVHVRVWRAANLRIP